MTTRRRLPRLPARRRSALGLPAILAIALLAAGCGGASGGGEATAACDGRIDGRQTLTVWARAGSAGERTVLDSQVATFNQRSESNVQVRVVHVPPAEYLAKVEAASAKGELPDVVELDGALLPRFAWKGDLRPLFGCLNDDLKANLLPRITEQGTYDGTLYGVGADDAGLAMYARRSVLEGNGLRVPSGFEDAWTSEETTAALTKLKSAGFDKPLELRRGDTRAEWWDLAYAPIVYSAGGDLLDRGSAASAQGFLNDPAVVKAMTQLQSWFSKGLVQQPRASDAFVRGDAAIAYAGQAQYAAYRQAFGADLVVLAPPDWGNGTRSGMGTSPWSITKAAGDGDAAWQFINFQLADDQVLETTATNGALPATRSALAKSPQFADGQPMSFFLRELQDPEVAVARPQTPAYPALDTAFQQAVTDIAAGKDPKAALDAAVGAIDADIKANDGYKPRR
jgi:multiple sugar transport system substrate-binding protein